MYKAGKKVGIIVPKESASLPGINPQPIRANHADMCRFEDEDREGFKNISQRLSLWISDLDRAGNSMRNDSREVQWAVLRDGRRCRYRIGSGAVAGHEVFLKEGPGPPQCVAQCFHGGQGGECVSQYHEIGW